MISALKNIVARHGIPEEIRSDKGLPFDSSKFLHFGR